MTINDRSSTTWDTRHPLHVLADGHGEVDVPSHLSFYPQLVCTSIKLHDITPQCSQQQQQQATVTAPPGRPLITPHRDDGPTSSLFQPHARPELCHLQDTPVALMPRPGLDG